MDSVVYDATIAAATIVLQYEKSGAFTLPPPPKKASFEFYEALLALKGNSLNFNPKF